MSIKVGDICKPVSGGCGLFDSRKGETVEIIGIGPSGNLSYDILDTNGEKVATCSVCFGPDNLEKILKARRPKKIKWAIVSNAGQATFSTKKELNEHLKEVHDDGNTIDSSIVIIEAKNVFKPSISFKLVKV